MVPEAHSATVALAEWVARAWLAPQLAPADPADQVALAELRQATAASAGVVLVDRKVLAQPALEEVLRLTVEQMVTKVTLIQEILPVVPQVPILEVEVEVLAKVNINHIQELVVLADRE